MRRERITITIRKDVIAKLDTIIDGQKIRNRSNAIETVLLNEFSNYLLDTAVILAYMGDLIQVGKRKVPKMLLPLQSSTLIEKNIETLKKVGIRRIIIALSDGTSEVCEYLGDGRKYGVEIIYVVTQGTGGILTDGKKYLTQTFLMINGDILLDTIDIADMYNFHRKHNATGTIAVAAIADPSQLGSVFMKGDLIIDFKEKPKNQLHQSNLINAGVYVLEPKVCEIAKSKIKSIEYDIFSLLALNRKIVGYQIGKNWIHLHDEKHYREYLKSIGKK